MIFAFSMVGAVINFITNLLILPKYFTDSDLGLVAPVTQFVAFGAVPLSVVTNLIIKYVTKYEANNEWGKLRQLVRDLIIFGIVSTVIMVAVFIIAFDRFFAVRVGIDSMCIPVWMLLFLVISSWRPLVGVLARSMQQYFVFGMSAFVTPLALLISAVVLLPVYGFTGYLVALVASTAISLFIAVYSVLQYFKPHQVKLEPYFDDCKGVLKKYLLLFSISAGVGWLWNFIPPFAVKHFLSNQDAAGFFVIFRLSQLPFYAVSSLMLVLMPMLSMKHEQKSSGSKIFRGSIAYTFVSGVLIVTCLYFVSPYLFKWIPQWRQYSEYSKYVWLMGFNVVVLGVNTIISTALAAKWNFDYVRFTIPITALFCFLTYLLFGWRGARAFIPATLWNYVNSHVNRGLYLLLVLMILCSTSLFIVLLCCYKKQLRKVY